ncbi:hypothetical protein MHYP_G00241900 [Metynnis hypsauchen]
MTRLRSLKLADWTARCEKAGQEVRSVGEGLRAEPEQLKHGTMTADADPAICCPERRMGAKAGGGLSHSPSAIACQEETEACQQLEGGIQDAPLMAVGGGERDGQWPDLSRTDESSAQSRPPVHYSAFSSEQWDRSPRPSEQHESPAQRE